MRRSKLTLAAMMLAGFAFLFTVGCSESGSGGAGDSDTSTDAAPAASQPD